MLPGWQCGASFSFCVGLLKTSEKPTLKAISTASGYSVVFLGELFKPEFAWWDPTELWRHEWESLPSGGTLVLDDTTIPKENTYRTEATCPLHSGAQHRIVRSQNALVALYVLPKGGVRLIWAELWRPEGPSKVQLARQVVERLLGAGLQPRHVEFDGAYFDLSLLRQLDAWGLKWTTRVRSNFKLNFETGPAQTPAQWESSVSPEKWHHYKGKLAYAKATTVQRDDLPKCRLVAVRRARQERAAYFLLSNDVEAGIQALWRRYGLRWQIESAFRFGKQKLGLSTYRHLSAEAAERHLSLVGVVFNFLQVLSQEWKIRTAKLRSLASKPIWTEPPTVQTWRVAS